MADRPVEEPRLGDQEHAGAGGADKRSLLVALPQPVHELRVAALHPDGVANEQRGNDRDVGDSRDRRSTGAPAPRARLPSPRYRTMRRRARRRTAASVGTASSNVPSSGKDESVSYMPVRLPIVASGSASSETRRGSRRAARVVDGTFEPFLDSLTLPPRGPSGDRDLDRAFQIVEVARWQLT